MSVHKDITSSLSPETVAHIQDIIAHFLRACDITYPKDVSLNLEYRNACYADAERRGFNMKQLSKPLDCGIAIGWTSYPHLKNYSTRVFIGVWTGLLVDIDDRYRVLRGGMEAFFDRLMRGERQQDETLDHLASMTHEFSEHWGAVSTSLAVTSEIDFLTSNVLDVATEDMAVRDTTTISPKYPKFIRTMGGLAQAYAVFAFPQEIDVKVWFQVLPDLRDYINHTNDLLSFFKEELKDESVTFIALTASSQGISRLQALKELADETAEGYNRGVELLRGCPEALQAYRSFCVGFVGFHALSSRYQLDQLLL